MIVVTESWKQEILVYHLLLRFKKNYLPFVYLVWLILHSIFVLAIKRLVGLSVSLRRSQTARWLTWLTFLNEIALKWAHWSSVSWKFLFFSPFHLPQASTWISAYKNKQKKPNLHCTSRIFRPWCIDPHKSNIFWHFTLNLQYVTA